MACPAGWMPQADAKEGCKCVSSKNSKEKPPAASKTLPGKGKAPIKKKEEKKPPVNKPGTCIFVANLHIRKTGGTAVRELFLAKEGWKQNLDYCASMEDHAEAAIPSGFNWMEVNCNPNLKAFNFGVKRLKEKVEPRGCKVVSTVLLRDPVEQTMAEWLYFFRDQETGMRNVILNLAWSTATAWATDAFAWSMAHSEQTLRLLTQNGGPEEKALWASTSNCDSEECKLGLPPLANCSAALSMLSSELDKVDVVGTMDHAEEFASFWLALGKKAGFEVKTLPKSGKLERDSVEGEIFDIHAPSAEEPKFAESEFEQATASTQCSSQIVAHIKKRHHQMMYAPPLIPDLDINVRRLLHRWGRENVAARLKDDWDPSPAIAAAKVAGNATLLKTWKEKVEKTAKEQATSEALKAWSEKHKKAASAAAL